MNDENDVQVLIKKDGKYYTLEPKKGISQEWAKIKRIGIAQLFNDYHVLKEVKINHLEKL